jgi:hypothetical protein
MFGLKINHLATLPGRVDGLGGLSQWDKVLTFLHLDSSEVMKCP